MCLPFPIGLFGSGQGNWGSHLRNTAIPITPLNLGDVELKQALDTHKGPSVDDHLKKIWMRLNKPCSNKQCRICNYGSGDDGDEGDEGDEGGKKDEEDVKDVGDEEDKEDGQPSSKGSQRLIGKRERSVDTI
jgi:hypothetical protein